MRELTLSCVILSAFCTLPQDDEQANQTAGVKTDKEAEVAAVKPEPEDKGVNPPLFFVRVPFFLCVACKSKPIGY
jgi:hypothetical protein